MASADAIVFALEHYSHDEPLNVGTGKDISIGELAHAVAAAVGYPGNLVFDASKPDGAPRRMLDSSRLLALGWHARTELADGLAQMYRWYSGSKAGSAT
jgi:GDP-L-fucose synthase